MIACTRCCFLVSDALSPNHRRSLSQLAAAGSRHLTCVSTTSIRLPAPLTPRRGLPCLSRRAPVNASWAEHGAMTTRASGYRTVRWRVRCRPGAGRRAPRNHAAEEPTPRVDEWGVFSPGKDSWSGDDAGELAISAYALVRYLNQMPGNDTFVDHLGNERPVDGRHDIFPHRVIVCFKGWLGRPKLDLQHRDLDGEHHEPGRALRQPRLPVQLAASLSTAASTAIPARARCRARIRTGSATIA